MQPIVAREIGNPGEFALVVGERDTAANSMVIVVVDLAKRQKLRIPDGAEAYRR